MLKKISIFLTTILVSWIFTWCSLSTISPVAYNDKIIDIIYLVDDIYEAYNTYAEETSFAFNHRIEERRLKTIKEIQGLMDKLEDIPAFGNDSTLIDIAREYTTSIIGFLENEDRRLVELWDELETIEENEYNRRQEAIVESFNTKYEAINDKFIKVQEAFAQRHGYELIHEDR